MSVRVRPLDPADAAAVLAIYAEGIATGHATFQESAGDWADWDATQLVTRVDKQLPILIDQGSDDEFLGDQLKPGSLEQAAICTHHPLEIRHREGYDHSYFFVASFIDDHLRHHGKALGLTSG